MNCEHIKPLCEAYALDALEPEEKLDVETHLKSCPACQRLVDDYASMLAELPGVAQAVAPMQAPKHIRDQVLGQIISEETLQPKATQPSWLERLFQLPRWVPAVVAVQAVVIITFGFLLFQQNSVNEQMTFESAQIQQAMHIMLAASQETQFLSPSTEAPEGSWGRMYTRPDMDVVVVLVADTPPAPENAEYRFWFKDGDSYVSSGVVHVIAEGDPSAGRGWLIAPKPEGFDQVMVTLDPVGSPTEAPNGTMILSANYS